MRILKGDLHVTRKAPAQKKIHLTVKMFCCCILDCNYSVKFLDALKYIHRRIANYSLEIKPISSVLNCSKQLCFSSRFLIANKFCNARFSVLFFTNVGGFHGVRSELSLLPDTFVPQESADHGILHPVRAF
jgi:hypothetical protein